MEQAVQKWYQKTWFIILALVLFFPLGAYLLCKYSSFGKNAKIFFLILGGAWFLCIAVAAFSGPRGEPEPVIIIKDVSYQENSTAIPSSVPQAEVSTAEKSISQAPSQPPHAEENTNLRVKSSEEKRPASTGDEESENQMQKVWIAGAKGKVYHSSSSCSNMKSPVEISLKEAEKQGLRPCSKCW